MNRFREKEPRFPFAAFFAFAAILIFGFGIWYSANRARAIRPPIANQPSIKQGPVEPYHRQNRITDVDREVLKSIIEKALERADEQ